MADGPTVVTTGVGGTAIAVFVAIAIAVLLFATGIIDIEGGEGGTTDVNVKVDAPAVEAPAALAPASASGG